MPGVAAAVLDGCTQKPETGGPARPKAHGCGSAPDSHRLLLSRNDDTLPLIVWRFAFRQRRHHRFNSLGQVPSPIRPRGTD